jgi:hypothetical protein
MRNVSGKVVEKIKTHVLCSVTHFPRKSFRSGDHVENYGRVRQATDDNIIWRMPIVCWIPKVTDTLPVCKADSFLRQK